MKTEELCMPFRKEKMTRHEATVAARKWRMKHGDRRGCHMCSKCGTWHLAGKETQSPQPELRHRFWT